MTVPESRGGPTEVLERASIHPDIFRLRPDYAALLVVADGLTGGPTDPASDEALRRAERSARELLEQRAVDALPQTVEWRDAYRAFGVKPRQARSSMESLLRRVPNGLPRIDRLTDTYNAVSVVHLLPVGGEDLTHYSGPPHLVIAHGDEPFETTVDGADFVGTADPGEVIWRDDEGVTCRRWNWRQCRRTRLTTGTTSALFILDALGSTGVSGLEQASIELTRQLQDANPAAAIATRLLRS